MAASQPAKKMQRQSAEVHEPTQAASDLTEEQRQILARVYRFLLGLRGAKVNVDDGSTPSPKSQPKKS